MVVVVVKFFFSQYLFAILECCWTSVDLWYLLGGVICDLLERGNRAWRSVLCKTFHDECGTVRAPRLSGIFKGTSAHRKGNRTLYIHRLLWVCDVCTLLKCCRQPFIKMSVYMVREKRVACCKLWCCHCFCAHCLSHWSTWFLPRGMNKIFKGCLAPLTLLAL